MDRTLLATLEVCIVSVLLCGTVGGIVGNFYGYDGLWFGIVIGCVVGYIVGRFADYGIRRYRNSPKIRKNDAE